MTQKWLLRIGRWLLSVIILLYLIQRLYELRTELSGEGIALVSPFGLLSSLILLLLYNSVLSLPWFFCYRRGSGTSIAFRSGWTFFQLSQLGRYLPGRVGQFVWMLSFSRRFGIEKTSAVLATCLQLAFQCGLGVIVGVAVLWDANISPLHTFWGHLEMVRKGIRLGGTVIVVLGVGAFLYRRRIAAAVPHLKKLFRAMFLVRLIGLYILLWGLLGIAFFLFIRGFSPVSTSQLFRVTGIYAIAWSLGFLSVVTPSGLGVREGVLSLLLTSVLPPATATWVALLSRLWTLSAELLIGGVAFGLSLRQRHIQHT